MKKLYSDDEFDFPVEYFKKPNGVEEVSICSITGLLASEYCPAVKELGIKKRNLKKCPGNHAMPKDSLGVGTFSAPSTTEE
jgi:hypothetical protein